MMQTRTTNTPPQPSRVWGLVLGLGLLLGACQGPDKSIRDYFFPLDSFADGGKIYAYESIGHPNDPPFWWFYRLEARPDGLYLLGWNLDFRYRPVQYVEQKVVSNGVLLKKFSWFEYDSTGRRLEVPVEVVAGNVLGFEVSDPPGVWLTHLRWQPAQDPANTLTFIRNRQFDRDTSWTLQGRPYESIKIYVRELVESDREGILSQEYDGFEIYARGWGQVYFRKNISDEWIMEYALKEVLEPAEAPEALRRTLEDLQR